MRNYDEQYCNRQFRKMPEHIRKFVNKWLPAKNYHAGDRLTMARQLKQILPVRYVRKMREVANLAIGNPIKSLAATRAIVALAKEFESR